MSTIDNPFHNVEQRRTIAIRDRLDGRIEHGALRHTQLARDLGVRNTVGSRTSDHLTEDRQRVPHASGPRASHQGQGRRFGRYAFGFADRGQKLLKILGSHEAKRVVVRPRSNRGEDLVRVGRGEDETHVLWRLLNQFQQGIEAGGGNHVGFVDDVDLVAR